jgi:hypothetical protein
VEAEVDRGRPPAPCPGPFRFGRIRRSMSSHRRKSTAKRRGPRVTNCSRTATDALGHQTGGRRPLGVRPSTVNAGGLQIKGRGAKPEGEQLYGLGFEVHRRRCATRCRAEPVSTATTLLYRGPRHQSSDLKNVNRRRTLTEARVRDRRRHRGRGGREARRRPCGPFPDTTAALARRPARRSCRGSFGRRPDAKTLVLNKLRGRISVQADATDEDRAGSSPALRRRRVRLRHGAAWPRAALGYPSTLNTCPLKTARRRIGA